MIGTVLGALVYLFLGLLFAAWERSEGGPRWAALVVVFFWAPLFFGFIFLWLLPRCVVWAVYTIVKGKEPPWDVL